MSMIEINFIQTFLWRYIIYIYLWYTLSLLNEQPNFMHKNISIHTILTNRIAFYILYTLVSLSFNFGRLAWVILHPASCIDCYKHISLLVLSHKIGTQWKKIWDDQVVITIVAIVGLHLEHEKIIFFNHQCLDLLTCT